MLQMKLEKVAHAEVGSRWLLLIHQIPPKPDYFRVKIWRKLQRLGAVAIKNSVYTLPRSDQAHEDLQWVLREIVEGGGDASICEAHFIEGLPDEQIEALFRTARDADYAALAENARRLLDSLPSRGSADRAKRATLETELARLKRRRAEIAAIDFFETSGRQVVDGLLGAAEKRLFPSPGPKGRHTKLKAKTEEFRGRTWVTRKGIHVDRMASAWLVRRFIDPGARFKFVLGKGYSPRKGELRFDMFEAEFTHEGDRCTFEVLLDRFGLRDPALRSMAEIVHDIDLKDAKYERPETPGVEHLIAGIAMAHKEDETRLSRGSAVLDDLHEYFKRKRS